MYGFGFNQPQIIGSLARASSFAEVQAAPVNANGSPTLFLLENSPEMYLVNMQGNQKSIQGYKMVPMPTAQEATEHRISNLEAAIGDIKRMLEGAVKNESNTPSTEYSQPAAANPAI